jgi:hypothetical protein
LNPNQPRPYTIQQYNMQNQNLGYDPVYQGDVNAGYAPVA